MVHVLQHQTIGLAAGNQFLDALERSLVFVLRYSPLSIFNKRLFILPDGIAEATIGKRDGQDARFLPDKK
jgi:hypothetical protein